MDYLLRITILLLGITLCATQSLEGTRMKCDEEGARIKITADTRGCFTCTCKNGYVDCGNCPKTDDCFLIVEDDGCCKTCKGCYYKGIRHESHTEWIDSESPCTTLRCEAGIVTQSNMICHTPCANPLPPEPGKCCPTCPECKINGQIASEDRDVISDDPCLKCGCSKGRMICAKKACPVLQCPPEYQEYLIGECCPKCKGTRTMITRENSCTIQSSLFREGHHFNIDRCTNCTCVDETSVCKRNACPILDCPPDMQKPVAGSCCKQCRVPEEIRTQCHYEKQQYKDGESWKLNECSSCKCHQGRVSCAMTKCLKTCPPGSISKKIKGECCPKCIEADGVCLVFGDPHYKTFDGKMYTFKGYGKYHLVSDCKNKTFYIKVANQMNKQLSSPTTKRVALKYGDVRVNLQHKSRIKVNGQLIKSFYETPGKIKVFKNVNNLVEVLLNNGVKLLWNGKSFLEVTVPATFKNNLCGLCGNFNGDVYDDMKARNGKIMRDNETNAFGASWCVGNKADCAKKVKPKKFCQKSVRSMKNSCNMLRRNEVFETCSSKLNYSNYYKACLADNCNCHDDKCHCESFMAYVSECQRIGAEISPTWKRETNCDPKSSTRRRKPLKKTDYTSPRDMLNLLKGSPLKINKTRKPIPLND